MYSKCQKCGRKLTDPESIEKGYVLNVGKSIVLARHYQEKTIKQ